MPGIDIRFREGMVEGLYSSLLEQIFYMKDYLADDNWEKERILDLIAVVQKARESALKQARKEDEKLTKKA